MKYGDTVVFESTVYPGATEEICAPILEKFSKNLKKPQFFIGFWDPEATQESLKRPKKAPRRSRESSKTFQKRDPKIDLKKVEFWSGFGSVLGTILGAKSGPKRSQKYLYNTCETLVTRPGPMRLNPTSISEPIFPFKIHRWREQQKAQGFASSNGPL